MGSFGTSRPPTERDTLWGLNGAPVFLGVLVSTGTAVNNATTATPFNYQATPQPPLGASALGGTLAGKVLLIQPTAAGLIYTSTVAGIGPNFTTVAQQSVVPPVQNTVPGFLLNTAAVGSIIIMPGNMGWLQWLPVTGSANLFVYELV